MAARAAPPLQGYGLQATARSGNQGRLKVLSAISGPHNWVDARERLAGHKRAMAEFGLSLDPNLLCEGDSQETGGSRALNELLVKEVKFTAVVCANDETAAGVMAVAHDRGLAVPGKLSMVGFDNAPMSRYLYPKLSTVDYPIEDMSRKAVYWVLRNFYGDDTAEIAYRFEPALLTRDSASRVKG